MSAQIKDLPDFDQVQREVQRHLKKIEFLNMNCHEIGQNI
jgi:hypothetical protein